MKITSLNYNNQTQNNPTAFKGTYRENQKFIAALREELPDATVDAMLAIIQKAAERIKNIKFKGRDVDLTTDDKLTFSKVFGRGYFHVIASIAEKQETMIVYIQNPAGIDIKGAEIGEKTVIAMEKATKKLK